MKSNRDRFVTTSRRPTLNLNAAAFIFSSLSRQHFSNASSEKDKRDIYRDYSFVARFLRQWPRHPFTSSHRLDTSSHLCGTSFHKWWLQASPFLPENGLWPPGFLLERERGKLPRKLPHSTGGVEEARAAVKWVSTVEAASLFCIVVIEDHVFTSRREYQGVRLRSKRIEMIAQRASICHLQIVLDNILETR